jgi:hypothetical protein
VIIVLGVANVEVDEVDAAHATNPTPISPTMRTTHFDASRLCRKHMLQRLL